MDTYFKEKLDGMSEYIFRNTQLSRALAALTVTNVVATCNLNVTLNLTEIAKKFPFCHYHKSTFAAMGIRLIKPWSALLLYPRGMMVCMGTTTVTSALLACRKYVQIMNELMGIPCSMAGFKVDNFVCSTCTDPLDLNECVRDEWARVIEYEHNKFPGATVRCEFMGLDFNTEVVMELFQLGKINITGAKSIHEAKYMFVLVYNRYIMQILKTSRRYKRQKLATDDIRVNTHLITPQVVTNELALRFFNRPHTPVNNADDDDDNGNAAPVTPHTLSKKLQKLDKMADF